MSRQIVLDTETTGLSAEGGDRILELGCVELVNRKPTGNNLHLYINPERDSHEDALRVHGITTEFLSDKPKFREVAEQIRDYLAGAELVIHNASFDMGFMDMEFRRMGWAPLSAQVSGVIDTLALAKELYPGKRNSLDALCDRLGIDNSNRTLHGALLDARLLADVYIQMTRGQEALLMVADEEGEAGSSVAVQGSAVDLRSLQLKVLQATPEELEAHASVMAEIDKASGGKTVWRQFEPLVEGNS